MFDYLTSELQVEFEIIGYSPAQKGGMVDPSFDEQFEFEAYFVDKNKKNICKVPEGLLELWHDEFIQIIKQAGRCNFC